MRKDVIHLLVLKRLSGDLSQDIDLEQWADEDVRHREWLDRITDDAVLLQEFDVWAGIDSSAAYERWLNQAAPRGRKVLMWRWFGWAAAAMVILAIGAILWKAGFGHKPTWEQPVSTAAAPIIDPGKNAAILTLGNGQKVVLDSMAAGWRTTQGNAKLTKIDSGGLAYSVTGPQDEKIVYNTLTTPRAAQFKLRLPDGTNVWLNNASSLRYPSSFAGMGTRTVELSGEAYFEVAKDITRPFLVRAGDVAVKVLSTGFNVAAFPDEPDIRTTLVEGRVKVERRTSEVVLQPGQQVKAGENGSWKVLKNVNTEEVTDWRNGLFNFDDADLQSTLRQLARWYDVTVEFNGRIPEKTLHGQIYRNLTLNEVLEILQADKDVHFKIEGRKVIVTP